jgi:hypothetical protein
MTRPTVFLGTDSGATTSNTGAALVALHNFGAAN